MGLTWGKKRQRKKDCRNFKQNKGALHKPVQQNKGALHKDKQLSVCVDANDKVSVMKEGNTQTTAFILINKHPKY